MRLIISKRVLVYAYQLKNPVEKVLKLHFAIHSAVEHTSRPW